MAGSGHENYAAWQVAMDLAAEIYRLTKLLPQEEKYTLGDQLRRAAISVPSNIAEGQARGSTREFVRFLYIARGSVAEIETQLLLAVRVSYLSKEEINIAIQDILDIASKDLVYTKLNPPTNEERDKKKYYHKKCKSNIQDSF